MSPPKAEDDTAPDDVAGTTGEPPSQFARRGAIAYLSGGAGLVANLLTGMMLARALAPSGRGELTAAITAPQIVAFVFAFSCSQAVAFHLARRTEDGPRLLGTWLVILAPLAVLALVVGEALVPVLLGAQTPETVRLAQIYMLTVVVVLLVDLMFGMLLGSHDFTFYNAVLVAQTFTVAVAYALLWAFDALTIRSALVVMASVSVLVAVVTTARVMRRHGIGRPSTSLMRSGLWFGTRAHGATVGSVGNARIDVLIAPAFLGAAQLGLYAVATSVASIVLLLSAQFATIVMPIAAREGSDGGATILRSTRVVLAIGAVIGTGLVVVAEVALRVVYGSDYADAANALRLLLVGSVLLAGANILGAGLFALDRPFTAFIPGLLGAVLTAVVIVAFVDDGGIVLMAAAWSVSQAIVFATCFYFYRRETTASWRDVVPTPRDVAACVAAIRRLR